MTQCSRIARTVYSRLRQTNLAGLPSSLAWTFDRLAVDPAHAARLPLARRGPAAGEGPAGLTRLIAAVGGRQAAVSAIGTDPVPEPWVEYRFTRTSMQIIFAI